MDKTEKTLDDFFLAFRELQEQCSKSNKPSQCHLDYFKALQIYDKISATVENQMKPFLEEYNSPRVIDE